VSQPDSQPTVETQLAVIRVTVDQLIELSKTRGEDHESRLRKLEERKFPLPTVAVLIALASLAASVLAYVTK
jgi:hypothetical protein